ncbi:MAG: hypothetical protein H7A53_09405 [Akkermansiaceae bacterium]|nr:hypothetical protein [Akkermansiaceae bacterium]
MSRPSTQIRMLTAFLDAQGRLRHETETLKVRSGIGDDAEYLADLGFAVTAFDIPETAITVSRTSESASTTGQRICSSRGRMASAFDFVWESYTLQVFTAGSNIARFVKSRNLSRRAAD